MKFLGLGVPELIIILVVILLIFGPKNLPKLGKAFGKSVSNLREGMNEGKKQVKGDAEAEAADAEAEAADDDKTPPALEAAVEEVEEVEEVVGADDDAMGNADDADNVDTAEEAPKKVVKKVVRKKVDAE